MNEIARQATVDKFALALQKEHLSKKEAGDCIGITPAQVSYLFNKHYWDKIGNAAWEKTLAWVNSGYSLKEFPQHRVVIPAESGTEKEIIVPEKKKSVSKQVKSVPKEKKNIFTVDGKDPRVSRGSMLDMLLEEKALLQQKIDAIDTLMRHYIS